MHLKFDGVNDSFRGLVESIHLGSIPTVVSPSRVGEVLQIPEPVTLSYSRPWERVLFNQARDCNPFFHVFESLWMLAGRNDIAPLDYYSSGYGKQVRDGQQTTANGAYGYRWRRHEDYYTNQINGGDDGIPGCGDEYTDQLSVIIDQLRRKPESRRVVLSMWNVEDDLLKIDTSRDVCCNLSCCFLIVDGRLTMTIFNRSNDLVWGSLGADFVHFSMLQEYVANSLGIPMGDYHQISNNLHCYTERWFPSEWLAAEEGKAGLRYYPEFSHVPLLQDREMFDMEVKEFVEANSKYDEVSSPLEDTVEIWQERFLSDTAQPMMNAFHCHKARKYEDALGWAALIEADDWRMAAKLWLQKRQFNWEKKNAEGSAATE